MLRFFKRCARSLFTRLALVMLLVAIAVNIVTYELFFSFQHDRETSFNRNLVQYAHFLVRELGSPPARDKAEELGMRLKMRITVDGPQQWSAGVNPNRFPEEHLRPWYSSSTVEAASLHDYHRIRVRTEPGSAITFDIFPSKEERADLRRYGLLFLGLTCLVMLAAYAAMRHLLRPVRWLTEGATAVRDGDLSRRVPEKRGGELRDLSHTFNQMMARLEGVMQAQQRLLLGVSHELRTPLTRLKLRLEMCGTDPGAQAMREDLLEMESMITSLLDAARMRHEAGNLKRAREDLSRLLTEAARRCSDRPPGIVTRLPEFPVPAWVDPERISTLISNLLDNALKYSGPDAAPVELSLFVEDGSAVIEVRDEGIGIPEEAVAHLFEPFFRVDESRTRESGGFGLGLSLCEAIVQAHGGQIMVESELGRGTAVTVRLPGIVA